MVMFHIYINLPEGSQWWNRNPKDWLLQFAQMGEQQLGETATPTVFDSYGKLKNLICWTFGVMRDATSWVDFMRPNS